MEHFSGFLVRDDPNTPLEWQHVPPSRPHASFFWEYRPQHVVKCGSRQRMCFKKEIPSAGRTNLTEAGRRGREENPLGKHCQVWMGMTKIPSPPSLCFDS